MANIVLLDRFFRKMGTHLVSCFDEVPHWPVILGIFGRSGDGKTAQLTASLKRCKVEIVRINAADLESGLAGEPGKHIARSYAAASMAIAKGMPTALVVDDIDTTVGEWEMNTGTVNHQQVLAELMHLADEPVDTARSFPRRVPVFVTGNNLTRLYPPLRRAGRMNIYAWRPEPPEVRVVVRGIFADIVEPRAAEALADEFMAEPLVFFAQVRQELVSEEMSRHFDRVGMVRHDMREYLLSKNRRVSGGETGYLTEAELLKIAERVRAERRAALQDFLRED
jgi:hypothetical protein